MRIGYARRLFEALAQDQRGGVAILFVFLTMGLFGFVALAIDTSIWFSTKQRLQGAADAGARAGAHELHRMGATAEEVRLAAQRDIDRFGFTTARGAILSLAIDEEARTVEATIATPLSLNFSSLVLHTTPTARVRAVAAAPASAPPCLTLLEPSAAGALDISSGNARIEAPTCRVQVNSTNKDAIKGGGGYINAAQICSAGGGLSKGTGSSVSVETCPTLPDPLAAWSPPTPSGSCLPKEDIKNQTKHLWPGNYCSGMVIDGSTVTFEAGDYYITGGMLDIKGNSVLKGTDVAFLITGDVKISIQSSKVDIKGRKEGPMAGFIFAASRTAKIGVEHTFHASDLQYEGAIYLPKHRVSYKAHSKSANIPPFTTFLVGSLKIEADSVLTLDNNFAASEVPVVGKIGAGVVLVE